MELAEGLVSLGAQSARRIQNPRNPPLLRRGAEAGAKDVGSGRRSALFEMSRPSSARPIRRSNSRLGTSATRYQVVKVNRSTVENLKCYGSPRWRTEIEPAECGRPL